MQRFFLGGGGLVHSDAVNVSLVLSISGASSGVMEEGRNLWHRIQSKSVNCLLQECLEPQHQMPKGHKTLQSKCL